MNDSKVEAGKIFLDYHMEEGKKWVNLNNQNYKDKAKPVL